MSRLTLIFGAKASIILLSIYSSFSAYSLNENMNSNYLSISDILVTNEKVPCKVLHDMPKMGFLDPSSADDDLKAGTSLDIPLWLAESLHSRRQPLVHIELPKIYKEAYRNILNADACILDLHKLNQYFYEFGHYVSKYDITGEVSVMLVNAFRGRFKLVLEASAANDTVNAIQPLSESERERALAAATAERALTEWLKTGDCLLTTANMVANHRKHKLAEMEML